MKLSVDSTVALTNIIPMEKSHTHQVINMHASSAKSASPNRAATRLCYYQQKRCQNIIQNSSQPSANPTRFPTQSAPISSIRMQQNRRTKCSMNEYRADGADASENEQKNNIANITFTLASLIVTDSRDQSAVHVHNIIHN